MKNTINSFFKNPIITTKRAKDLQYDRAEKAQKRAQTAYNKGFNPESINSLCDTFNKKEEMICKIMPTIKEETQSELKKLK